MTNTSAKLAKLTVNGAHVGWQSHDRTVTVEKVPACSGGGWAVQRAGANQRIPPLTRTLADARILVAEILATRTEAQAIDDRAARDTSARCAAASGYSIA